MDNKKTPRPQGDLHLTPDVFANAKASLDHALSFAVSGNTTIQQLIVVAGEQFARNTFPKYRIVYKEPIPSKPMQRFAEAWAANMTREKLDIAQEIAGGDEKKAKSLVSQFNTLLKKHRVRFEPDLQ